MRRLLSLLAALCACAALAQGVQSAQGIEQLRADTFGQGTLSLTGIPGKQPGFTRHELRFTSDGLTQYGFVNVPEGQGPFPVVLVLHGYVNPQRYRTLAYTTRYADALARAGFLVIHPDYRGHGRSQGSGEGAFRIGYARDVLNLIALVQRQAGNPGPLGQADPQRLGVWGHSMGGAVAQRVAVVNPDVRAVLLYGAMSGDERQNARQIHEVYTRGARGGEELRAPQGVIDAVSPINFLTGSRAAWSVHHGTRDSEVPPAWSDALCRKLKALGKPVECLAYAGSGHLFSGQADAAFQKHAAAFFRRALQAP